MDFFSNSVFKEKGLIYTAYTLQRYIFSGTIVLKVAGPRGRGMHSLYEPVHGIRTYRISTKASDNRLFWLEQSN